MILRSLLLIASVALPLTSGPSTAAEPPRGIIGSMTMAMEWKSLSAVRSRVHSDWSTVDSITRMLKLGSDPELEKGLEKAGAELAEAKATLAARTREIEAKLSAGELQDFKEEQKGEASLVAMLQTLEGMRKDGRAGEPAALDLGARAHVLAESLKVRRAAISSSLGGVVIPAEVKPGSR